MAEQARAVESFDVTNPGDGVRMRCLRWGDGPRLIVAVHGLNAHGRHWRRTAERLGPEYRLVAYDLRGHGDSDKPDTGYTYEDHASDLAAVVRAAGGDAEPPVMLGHSLGARIAMYDVVAHRPRGFVIVDPGIVAHVDGAQPRRTDGRRRNPLRVEYDSREAFMERMSRTESLRNWNEYNQEYAEHLIEPAGHDGKVRLKLTPEALQQTSEAIQRADLSLLFGRIACPTLIIRATEGHLSEAMAARMHAEIPGSELVTIEGANHNVMLDKPDEFDAALDPFLERLFA